MWLSSVYPRGSSFLSGLRFAGFDLRSFFSTISVWPVFSSS